MDKIYKIAVIGPTGVGKSQFCNYIQKDYTNSKNEVSDSLDSCTQDPSPNIFERQNTTFNFIDTAGNNDSTNNDDKNLEKLVNYLREIKEINNIFLLLTFGERLSHSSREYIKKLGKIFTPMEFYNHLVIVFTKSGSPEKQKKKKEKNKEEVTKILKESFKIEDTIIGKVPDVYFVDIEYDEDSKTFVETSQDTIDIILKKLLLDEQIYKYKPIDTSNLDLTGENLKKREEREKYEFELIKKKYEEMILQKEAEEKKKKQLEEILKKKKKDEQAQKELVELLKKQEEVRKKNEERLKQIEKEKLELRKKEEAIREEARKKKILIDKLDVIIDKCGLMADFFEQMAKGGILLAIGGAALSIVCPVVGPIIIGVGAEFIVGGGFGALFLELLQLERKLKK